MINPYHIRIIPVARSGVLSESVSILAVMIDDGKYGDPAVLEIIVKKGLDLLALFCMKLC